MSANGRFLRHRFSPKSKSVATVISLPKRNHVAKEAVSAAWHTKTCQQSVQHCKPSRGSKGEAAALRKNHVVGPIHLVTLRPKQSVNGECPKEEGQNRSSDHYGRGSVLRSLRLMQRLASVRFQFNPVGVIQNEFLARWVTHERALQVRIFGDN